MAHVLATARGNRELRAAPPYAPFGDSTPPPPGWGGGAEAGVAVNQNSAFGVAAVYSAIGILTDAVSSLPIRVLDSPPSMLATAKVLASSPLILQPYAEISRIDWVCQFVASLALRGNFYGQIIERDQNQYATQIKPIPPDHASVRRKQDGTLEYRYFNTIIPSAQVFHVKYISMPGMLVGLNPIEHLRVTFALGLAQERYASSFFANSALPNVVISHAESVSPDEAAAVKKAWLAAFQGLNKANQPVVLGGDAKVTPLMMTLEDAQFLESRQYTGTQIAQLFRIPPHMLSQTDRTTSWGTGIEQQERGFVANTLQGYLSRIEESLTLLHPKGQFVNFDLEARVKGDSTQQATIGSMGMLGGFFTADEVRARFNLPPLPDGQGKLTFLPSNSELLEQAIDEFENPTPPAPMGFGGGSPPPNGAKPAGARPMPAKKASVARSNRDAMDRELATALIRAITEREQVALTVNPTPLHIEPSVVHVHPEIRVEVPPFEIPTPVVNFDPKIVVEAARQPDVHVTVPPIEIPQTVVNVPQPVVNIKPPVVNVNTPPKRSVKVVRGKDGRITGIEET